MVNFEKMTSSPPVEGRGFLGGSSVFSCPAFWRGAKIKRLVLKTITHPLFLLWIIFILGTALRFYKISSIPQALNRDEAANGYNAYSIFKTGKDEYGVKYPFWFLSIGDYKPPIYLYLNTVFISIFGFNELAIRLTAALSGSLSIIALYFLLQELLNHLKTKAADLISLSASLLLATAPWHFFYSRQLYEEPLALFLVIMSVWCLLKARLKPWFFIGSLVFSGLAVMTYNPPLFILPILLPAIILIYFSDYKKNLKAASLFLVALIAFFIIYFLISKPLITGRSEATIFNNLYLETQLARIREGKREILILPQIFSRKKPFIAYQYFSNYLSSFNYYFLFEGGDNHLWHGIKFGGAPIGNQYLITLPFFIFGLFYLLESRKKGELVILIWFLISPIAYSFTHDAPNTNRLQEFLILFLIITAYGLFNLLKATKNRNIYITAFTILFCFSVINYLHIYFFRYNIRLCDFEYRDMNLCGMKQIADYIQKNKYEHIVFMVNSAGEEPYIQMAFHLKFNPADFQKKAKREKNGFIYVRQYNNFYFLNYNRQEDLKILKILRQNKNNLYILRGNWYFDNFIYKNKKIYKKEIFRIKDYNNKTLWLIGK